MFIIVSRLVAPAAGSDSLALLLEKARYDSIRVDIMLQMGYELYSFYPDSAVRYIEEALRLTKKNINVPEEGSSDWKSWQLLHARALRDYARKILVKGDYPKALDMFQESMAIFDAQN
ncbi:MAG: hypothetical protein ABIJ16_07660, partial [Bacteroidota bacterium]